MSEQNQSNNKGSASSERPLRSESEVNATEAPGKKEPVRSETSEGTFVRVGKVKDAHGIRGELFIVLFAGEAAWLNQLKSIRLVNDPDAAVPRQNPHQKLTPAKPAKPQPQGPLTYAVKSARLHKNGLIVKTAEVRDRNQAEEMRGMLLEVPESFLVSKPGEELFLREVLGFSVIDLNRDSENIGKVTAFSSNGAQDLLVVDASTGKVEIPFVADFVEKIDYAKKELRMKLPLGLLGDLEGEESDEEVEDDSFVDDNDYEEEHDSEDSIDDDEA